MGNLDEGSELKCVFGEWKRIKDDDWEGDNYRKSRLFISSRMCFKMVMREREREREMGEEREGRAMRTIIIFSLCSKRYEWERAMPNALMNITIQTSNPTCKKRKKQFKTNHNKNSLCPYWVPYFNHLHLPLVGIFTRLLRKNASFYLVRTPQMHSSNYVTAQAHY